METSTIAFISAVASVTCAVIAGISAYLSYKIKQKEGMSELERELNRILNIGIQYPHFEYLPFTSSWTQHRNEDNEIYLRYDIYCNMIFNFLHHVFEYYSGRKESIEKYIDVKNWIRIHKQNWQNPADDNENIDGYDEPFRQFINSYLR